ncbi:MAG TPA: GNAT family N-acetyltransferase [Gaiellaceae bacterium]
MKIEVRDNPAALQYEVSVDGEPAGVIRYTLGGDVVTLVHTEVEPKYEGHGVGAALVKGALDDLRARGKKIVPLCEYVLAYLERHDEYRDLVQE